MNPGLPFLIGTAIPLMPSEPNSNILNDVLAGISSLSAISPALNPRSKEASVTNTRSVIPKVVGLMLPGTTRAKVCGIAGLTTSLTGTRALN